MRVAKTLVNWCDKTYEEALVEPNPRKSGVKAFASGAVEGFIDAAIVMYIPVLIMAYAALSKNKTK